MSTEKKFGRQNVAMQVKYYFMFKMYTLKQLVTCVKHTIHLLLKL